MTTLTTWEFRVLRYTTLTGYLYAIHKVGFRDGAPVDKVREPVPMVGEHLFDVFAMYYTALKKPWLDAQSFEEVPAESMRDASPVGMPELSVVESSMRGDRVHQS